MSSQVYRLDTTSKSLSLLNSKLMSDLGYYEVGRTVAKAHVSVKIIQRRIGAPSAAGDAAGRSDDKAMGAHVEMRLPVRYAKHDGFASCWRTLEA
jgi:hypothetical protein